VIEGHHALRVVIAIVVEWGDYRAARALEPVCDSVMFVIV
jgi:hypothetical protein